MSQDASALPTHPDHRRHVNDALSISIFSVAWTVVASGAAIVLGVQSHTAVLVAFGAIGTVDAIGSLALIHHFRHARLHDAMSDDLEQLAHRIVLVGLLTVGCASVVGGVLRLFDRRQVESSTAGVIVAAASLIALIILSVKKQRIARRVASPALLSDGHLSGIGAAQAAVTLAGTAITRWLGWLWADASATILVGVVAVSLAVSTMRATPPTE
jgi:divalent metal cation (Fe/Co/Zn/Cd) transporter